MPMRKNKIPTNETKRIGAYENATKESMSNFIFLEIVHLDLPILRSFLSYEIEVWEKPIPNVCKKMDELDSILSLICFVIFELKKTISKPLSGKLLKANFCISVA